MAAQKRIREGKRERRGSVVRYVSLAKLAPPTSVEALHTAGAGALSNGASATEPQQHSSTATACRVSPMELPLGGPALRHYTQSRPRPHRQKLNYRPSRPQETIIESEHEGLEHMGRVDEGVEEFFTKRVLPTDTLSKPDEETIVVEEDVAPASAVPCPPPSKTLRRKLGDFFTLKKRRGLKSEPSQEGRPKKTSIADLIRPLREAAKSDKEKDKERVKENDRENEKDKGKDHPNAVTGESAVQETPGSGDASLRGEAVPPRRAHREGKSQSLILLSGSAATGTTNARNSAKKQFEGQHSFEQKLHLMLQRIGVSKPQPSETQNQDGEMKKAESEGTIIDNKPEPPPTLSKPRTMSASSDIRHPIRASVSAHEAAGKPALPPKPIVKPGPPPTASGRNTPENELTQIQEVESNIPTKRSPDPDHAAPAPSEPTDTPPLTEPDSAGSTVSDSSTVNAADTHVSSDKIAAEATTPTGATRLENNESDLSSIEPPTSTILTTLQSPTLETEPPNTVSAPSTGTKSTTTDSCLTSSTNTASASAATTQETVSPPCDQMSVFKTSDDLPTESTEPDSTTLVGSTPAPTSEANLSDSKAVFSPSTSVSDMASGVSATDSFITKAGDETPPLVSSSTETVLTSVYEATHPLSSSTELTPVVVLTDVSVATSSTFDSAVPPATSASLSVLNDAMTPSSSSSMNSASLTTITTTVSVPSTSSSEINPKDATSTTTSSNREESTPILAVVAAVCSSCTNSDISHISTTDASPVASQLPTDNTSAIPNDVISSVPTDEGSDKNKDVHETNECGAGDDKEENPTEQAIVEQDAIQTAKLNEVEEKEEITDIELKEESSKDKTELDETATVKVQVESVKAEENTFVQGASVKETEQSRDESNQKTLNQEKNNI